MPDAHPQKPDAIFFDWDGTFVDTLPAIHHAYNHVLAAFDKPLMSLEEAKQKIRRSAREIFPEIFGDDSSKAFAMYYDVVGKTHLDHLHAFDGGAEFLTEIKSRGLTTGLISNKRHMFLHQEVTHLGWESFFNVILGAGEAAYDKPAPDPLLLAARKAGVMEKSNWYVGDTETDMQAAVAAKFSPVFITHGLGTREDCHKAGVAPYFVDDFQSLIRLVEKF